MAMTNVDVDEQPYREVSRLAPLNHPSYSPYHQNGQLEHMAKWHCEVQYVLLHSVYKYVTFSKYVV